MQMLRGACHIADPQHVAVAQLIDDPGEERVYVVLEYLEKGPVHQDGCDPA
jgi:hypothetical protein